ncbi:hypothetical protein BH24ACT26_BH24ACT26_01610 [soil metagenome]
MRSQAWKRLLACSVSASIVLGASGAQTAPATKKRARVAVRYLVSRQGPGGGIKAFTKFGSTADSVTSMVAAKRSPAAIRDALGFLRRHPKGAKSVGLKAKLVLALVAAGKRPRAFASRNWVAKIKATERPSGRLGKSTPVFEHALALLALKATGAPSANAVAWLEAAQCNDGGWQYDAPQRANENEHCQGPDAATDFYRSEADATSLAVQALDAACAEPMRDPFAFFALVRDPIKHGWGYTQRFRLTNANSTALVLQAFAAENREPPGRAVKALTRLQYRLCGRNAGAFAYSWEPKERNPDRYRRTGPDVGATIGAIPGLLGRPFPVTGSGVTKPAPRAVAC